MTSMFSSPLMARTNVRLGALFAGFGLLLLPIGVLFGALWLLVTLTGFGDDDGMSIVGPLAFFVPGLLFLWFGFRLFRRGRKSVKHRKRLVEHGLRVAGTVTADRRASYSFNRRRVWIATVEATGPRGPFHVEHHSTTHLQAGATVTLAYEVRAPEEAIVVEERPVVPASRVAPPTVTAGGG